MKNDFQSTIFDKKRTIKMNALREWNIEHENPFNASSHWRTYAHTNTRTVVHLLTIQNERNIEEEFYVLSFSFFSLSLLRCCVLNDNCVTVSTIWDEKGKRNRVSFEFIINGSSTEVFVLLFSCWKQHTYFLPMTDGQNGKYLLHTPRKK